MDQRVVHKHQRLRRHLSTDRQVVVATVLFALSTLALGAWAILLLRLHRL